MLPKRKSQFKVLAIDVDGTLLFGEDRISETNRKALFEVKDHAMISLCTGRSPKETEWIIHELELQNSFHVLGGGAILRHPGGDLHHLSQIDQSIISDIRSELAEHQLFYLTEGRWHSEVPENLQVLNSVSALAIGEKLANEVSSKLQAVCTDYYVTTVADKDNYWVQVTAPQCHKGSGIAHLIKHMNLKPEEVLAVGDMYNDVPMFEYLPFSVAMGNAPDDVKNKASYVTREVHHDGLAHAIWEFFFEK